MSSLREKKKIIRIKNFLFSKKNKEFLIFLLFLLLSASFWISQALSDEFEVEISMPLKLTNVPDDVVITTDLPANVSLTVRDKGTLLMGYVYGNRLSAINVNYATNDKGETSGRVVMSTEEIRESVEKQLLSSTTILSISPDTLEYFFNKGARKKVPVEVLGEIETSPEYYVREIVFSPESVAAFAPSIILDTMGKAYINPLYYSDLKENKSLTVSLQKEKGVKFIPESVNMKILVDMYTEKTVEVPIVGVNFPATKSLRTFPTKVNVTFKVGMYAFKDITADDFVITVSYEELLQEKNEKLLVHLKAQPQNISNVRIEPDEVDYLIEQVQEELNAENDD